VRARRYQYKIMTTVTRPLPARFMMSRPALAVRPTLVTPNAAEVEALFGQPVDCDAAAAAAARHLVAAGAGNAVISRGPDGLVAAVDGRLLAVRLPESIIGNPTGAGDALTAALAQALSTGRPWDAALADAVAVSAGAVAEAQAGRFHPAVADRVRPDIVVEEI
jgi:tagatose 6-phosphate kinase